MRLNHITLPVSDLKASISFYQQLGLTLIVDSPGNAYARFECPDEDAARGATLSLHEATTPVTGAVSIYFEVDDVDARIGELEAAGFVFEKAPTDQTWLWREAWTRDPDGNRIAIYHAGENRRFPPWRV